MHISVQLSLDILCLFDRYKICKVQYAEVMMVIKLQNFICILDVVNTASIQSSILRKRLRKKKVLTSKPVDLKF